MQKVTILGEDGKPVLDIQGREKICYSLDANEAIRQGAYVVAESHTVKAKSGHDILIIDSVRPKNDADRKADAAARKKAAQKAIKDAEATLQSQDVLDLEPKTDGAPDDTSTPVVGIPDDEPSDDDFGDIDAPVDPEPKPNTQRKSPRRKK